MTVGRRLIHQSSSEAAPGRLSCSPRSFGDRSPQMYKMNQVTASSPAQREEGRPLILIGTHHKTGTKWLFDVFKQICEVKKVEFFNGPQRKAPKTCAVLFQDQSQFDLAALPGSFRGLHMIRDPRDVIVSGAFYHRHSHESWLKKRRWCFGLRTYQEALNKCASDEAALRFEMEQAAGDTIRNMLAWNYTDPRFFEVRYEDLIQDESLELFRRIFTFLGYADIEMPELLRIAQNNSLFSDRVSNPGHVRSGAPAQWTQHFTPALKARFTELYGDALERLGYVSPGGEWK